jgi:hypothetical protein
MRWKNGNLMKGRQEFDKPSVTAPRGGAAAWTLKTGDTENGDTENGH